MVEAQGIVRFLGVTARPLRPEVRWISEKKPGEITPRCGENARAARVCDGERPAEALRSCVGEAGPVRVNRGVIEEIAGTRSRRIQGSVLRLLAGSAADR